MVTVENVVERLKHFGFEAQDGDLNQIEFELQKIINYTLNYCNISEIPEMIEPRLIDRVCADFLGYRKNSGLLEGFNYDLMIKSIKEGDTQIQYSVGHGEDTPENRFDTFVRALERGYDKWITPWRRLRW